MHALPDHVDEETVVGVVMEAIWEVEHQEDSEKDWVVEPPCL